MELHFQSSDISVSGNLLIPNPYRFYFQIFCISAVRGGQSAEPPLIFACSGGSPPNGEASETFLLHHFLPAESAAPSGAQTPKLDTRASAMTDAETARLGAAAALPPGGRPLQPLGVCGDERPSVATGAGFYRAPKRCTGTG